MGRRLTALGLGVLLLGFLALFPSIAGAQDDYPIEIPTTTTTTVLGTSTVPETTTTTTTEATTTTTEATTTTVRGIAVVPTTQARQAVAGDVVSRPLPRTGNDIGGTAIFGGALTVLGIALALGARKRRNSFDGV